MQITKPNRVTRSCTQRLVAPFTEEHYEQFMHAWESRMNHYLTHGEAFRASPA